jgi:hypothetical protein
MRASLAERIERVGEGHAAVRIRFLLDAHLKLHRLHVEPLRLAGRMADEVRDDAQGIARDGGQALR